MSISLHVDSRWRDRSNSDNLNPAEFTIPVTVTQGWKTPIRTVQAVRPHNKLYVTNLVQSIRLLNLSIPYDIDGSTNIVNISPFLYVQLECEKYCDTKILDTLENGRVVNETPDLITGTTVRGVTLKNAIFVAYYDKTQGTGPNWIHYKTNQLETYRFKLDDYIRFRVFTPDGKTLPIIDNIPPNQINPSRQVTALFEVTPYAREGEYDNHFETLYEDNQ